jgi:NodT family efflux transporter outer membrane factor (OMF) lipoprotein
MMRLPRRLLARTLTTCLFRGIFRIVMHIMNVLYVRPASLTLRVAPVALIVLATACGTPSAPPRHATPQAPTSFSRNGQAKPPAQWWRELGDPGLNAWMERALTDNFSVRMAWDRLSQAEAVAARQGASRFPTLDGTAGAARSRTTRESGTESANEFSLGLVAAYEIDLWGRVRSARAAAALDATAAADAVQVAALTLAAEMATTWIQRAEQTGQIALLQHQLETNQNILTLLNQRFGSGQAAAVDVLQQEQLVEARRGDVALARARLAVLENRLAVLAGLPPGSPLPETAATTMPPPLPATGLPVDLALRRPDILRACRLVEAADQRAAVALADRFPRLSITARATTTAPSVSDLFDDWMANLAANLIAPLIDGGQRRAETRRTKAALSEALNNYQQTVLLALAEVENALTQEAQQDQLIESLRRQLTLSQAAMERLRERYRSGSGDFLRVLSAEISHQTLERNLLTAERQRLEYRIALYRALSGGLELQRPDLQTVSRNDVL